MYRTATPPLIRYFAATDETPLGQVAVAYLDAMADMGLVVRLVSSRVAQLQVDRGGKLASRWDRHRQLLLTPVDGPYVNLVCCEAQYWKRLHTARAERNVLIAPQDARGEGIDLAAAGAYDRLIVYSETAAEPWRAAGRSPLVLPPAPSEAFRAALMSC